MNSNVNYGMTDIINFANKNKTIIIVIILLLIVIMYFNGSSKPSKCNDSEHSTTSEYSDINEHMTNEDEQETNGINYMSNNIEYNDNIQHDNIEHMTNIEQISPNVIHVNNVPINEAILTPRTKEIVLSCIVKTNKHLDTLNEANSNNDTVKAKNAIKEIDIQSIKFDSVIKLKENALKPANEKTNDVDILKNTVKLNAVLTSEELKDKAKIEQQNGNINKSINLLKESEKHETKAIIINDMDKLDTAIKASKSVESSSNINKLEKILDVEKNKVAIILNSEIINNNVDLTDKNLSKDLLKTVNKESLKSNLIIDAAILKNKIFNDAIIDKNDKKLLLAESKIADNKVGIIIDANILKDKVQNTPEKNMKLLQNEKIAEIKSNIILNAEDTNNNKSNIDNNIQNKAALILKSEILKSDLSELKKKASNKNNSENSSDEFGKDSSKNSNSSNDSNTSKDSKDSKDSKNSKNSKNSKDSNHSKDSSKDSNINFTKSDNKPSNNKPSNSKPSENLQNLKKESKEATTIVKTILKDEMNKEILNNALKDNTNNTDIKKLKENVEISNNKVNNIILVELDKEKDKNNKSNNVSENRISENETQYANLLDYLLLNCKLNNFINKNKHNNNNKSENCSNCNSSKSRKNKCINCNKYTIDLHISKNNGDISGYGESSYANY